MSRINPYRPRHLKSQFALGHYRPAEVAGVAAFTALVLAVFAAAAAELLGLPALEGVPLWARWVLRLAGLVGTVCVAYGAFIEPFRLRVRTVELRSPKIGREPLRILHLSDIHIRRWGALEDAVLRAVKEAAPDLILVSGDITAFPTSIRDARRFMAELSETAPTFCSRGNSEFRTPRCLKLTEGTRAAWLLNEGVPLSLRGTKLFVAGVDAGDEDAVRAVGRRAAPEAYAVCLYHYPDLIPQLKSLPYDLMLCGHTHGGQVRLPWIGAVIGASRAGVRYAYGLFRAGGKAAFVSAGIGCRSYGLPRLRFLCPPELALIILKPAPIEGARPEHGDAAPA